MVNYLLIDVAQVYRVYMISELALDAAMGMKRIWVISPGNVQLSINVVVSIILLSIKYIKYYYKYYTGLSFTDEWYISYSNTYNYIL